MKQTVATTRSRPYDLFKDSPLRGISPLRLALFLVLVGLIARMVRYALGFPVWGDEAFVAIDFIIRDFAGMLDPLTWGQIVPLGYLWATEAVTRIFGHSEWSLRGVSFVAGIAALLLFWRFADELLTRRAALLATAIFAVSYYPIRHATEVKPYATDLLIALAALMLTWRLHLAPRDARRWLTLTLFGALAPWCSYPVIFVLAACGFLLLADALRMRAVSMTPLAWAFLYGAVSGVSFLAMYLTFGKPQAQSASGITEIAMWAKTFPPLAEPWKLPLWAAYIHSGNMLAYPHGGAAGGSTATLLLVIIGAVHLWRTGRRGLLWLLLGPLVFAFAAAAVHAYPYGGSARTTLYMAPAFCLLAGVGIVSLLRGLKLTGARLQVVVNCIAVGLAVFGLVMIGQNIAEPYKNETVIKGYDAVRVLAEETRPGDRWVVFNAAERVPYAPFLGDWRGTGGQFVFDAMRFGPEPVLWSPPPDSLRSGSERVLLLAYRGVKVDFPEDQFAAYRQALQAALDAGDPSHKTYEIKEREGQLEAIEAYWFERK